MIKNRDIVIVGQQPWDVEIGSNCKNIALEFSKYNRVLYVNPSLDRITSMRHRNEEMVIKRLRIIRKTKSGLIKISHNLWNLYPDQLIESINWIKNDWIYNYLNKGNNHKLARAILKVLTSLQFDNVLLFNDGDIFRSFYLNEFIKPEVSIYYSRDNLLATEYYKFHGAKLEPLLIGKSSVCVANSTFLYEYCKKYNPNSFYVGQGCETLFSSAIPTDIVRIKRPLIGYVGALLSARLDIETLEIIAESNADFQVVLVGPEDKEFKDSKLHKMANVHFLGLKCPGELADYINAFDVCINPQILNDLTIGNYPRKIDEYLSMGKPVVATRTKAMEVFQEYVYLAESSAEYPLLIVKALKENNEKSAKCRQDFAAGHTWENSVNEIYNAIETVTDNLKLQL